jgi:ribosomal protein S18 acetylase RimI-like enzyme
MKLAELSRGWRSEFIVHRFDALVAERDDCIVVRTPHNPTFYWGNFLLLPDAPRDDQLAHWLRRFDEEIAAVQSASAHVAIGVNASAPISPLPAWEAAGFCVIENALLRLERGQLQAPPRAARGQVGVRPIDFDDELDAFVDLQCADGYGFEPAGYRVFRTQRMQRMQAMAAQGLAQWFGLWCGGVLAADCGLVRDGALGRFQNVATHPAWRRRGLCAALVHAVSRFGFEQWALDEILMIADPHDVAIGIYESLGYRAIEHEFALQRYAPQDEGARRA